MNGLIEKREAKRFRVDLPVCLDKGIGIAHDFSASGVLFETERAFAVGASFSFLVSLAHAALDMPLLLRCRGRVVRVEQRNGSFNVGAKITLFTLVT